MRRKLVRMGAHSYMTAIPKRWIKKHNLKKGDYVDFVETDNKLVLTSISEIYERKAEVSIDSPKMEIVWRTIQPLYTSGYDEIKINITDPRILKTIERSVNMLIGFEITETDPDYIMINSVSKQLDENIQPILKRTWYIVKQVALITENAFVNKDKTRLEEIFALEQTINKYTMLLKRVINRTGYKYPQYTYLIITFLELTANHYEYIRRYYLLYPKAKIRKEYAEGIKKVNKLMFDIIDLQYNYSQEKFNKIALELPHFTWFKDMPDGEIKQHFISITEYLVQISRNLLSIKI